MSTLTLLPSGHLSFQAPADAASTERSPSLTESLKRAFAKGVPELLLELATHREDAPLPPVFAFWRRLGERFLTELCHIPETAEDLAQPIAPPTEELALWAGAAPPMVGGEYLNVEVLERLWSDLDVYARQDAASVGGFSKWLKQRSPLWHRVGRVCFHLAEHKRDPEYPFAFLATYAPKLLNARTVQYQPLSKALEEYAGASNKKTLIHLLTPVQQAAGKLAWVRELVDSGEIFHPLAWSPNEAYRFLQDIPLLEESGLLVRVPNWWNKRPARVQAGITVGRNKKGGFGVEAMLDFHVEASLDGEPLTADEWRELRESNQNLIFLKGTWIEVDRERLTEALEHWKRVEKVAGKDGLSFIEGMRLLAGAQIGPGATDDTATGRVEWSFVRAGEWLEERLREMRRPETQALNLCGAGLKAELRAYQETGVQWLRTLTGLGLGACLADDMGLGKTIQVLALLLLLKQRTGTDEPPAPSLLVLPASLLGNWKSELERFAPSLRACFLHPSMLSADEMKRAALRPDAFFRDVDAVFTTYAMLGRLEWLSGMTWRLAVVDEAQAIKNPAARQTKAVKKLNTRARIALTGTPVENRLADLWSIFDFLCPGLLGSAKAFGDFVKQLERRASDQYGPLRRLVGPYILRRLKTDKSIIADLPDKTEVQAYCSLTKKQAVLYAQAVDDLEQALEGRTGIERRGVVLAAILRFKQLCNHPAQYTAAPPYAPEESGKFQRLREICEEIAERQEKLLLFSQFREMTEPLAAFLETVFRRPGLVLHGAVGVGKRKQLVDTFQREDGPPFFVLSLKAGGVGLNLTAASHVIHFDRWWNPAVENQATDRAFRIGQKRNVMVHKFICKGTVEEKIDALIREKTALAGEILQEGVPALITEMNDQELLNLVRLDMNSIAEE